MPCFQKSQIDELREYLYRSDIHDAKVVNSNYKREQNCLYLEAYNSEKSIKIKLIFLDVQLLLWIKGDWLGCQDTILSLSVEDDYQVLQCYTLAYTSKMTDSLYLLFQTFSGDEAHIISSKLFIDIE